MFIVLGRDISLVLWTHEISLHKNNSHDLRREITHSVVLVIILKSDMERIIFPYHGKSLIYQPGIA